jgi:hypothetical protein
VLITVRDSLVVSLLKIGARAMVAVAALALGAFLISQGLVQASLWAAVLGLPLSIVIALAGLWSAVLTAKALARDSGSKQLCQNGETADAHHFDEPRRGSIHQDRTGGITIAHTGDGDITITGTSADGPDHDIR